MSTSLVIQIILIFIFILINGFFSAAEIAIVSARHSRLQQQIDEGNKQAHQALDLAEHPERFLATVQIGITLVATLTSAIGEASIGTTISDFYKRVPYLQPYADSLALVTVVLLITYFTLVLGELVPKRLALQFAERIAVSAAPIMVRLSILMRPIVAILNGSVKFVLSILNVQQSSDSPVTEEDIVYLTHEGVVSGTVESRESEFINRVFDFTDRPVSEVMTPRTEIVAVEVGTSLKEVTATFLDSGYSRLPLYQDSLDNIVGILYAKDLLRVLEGENVDLVKIARTPLFVIEYQHADDLLSTLRRQSVHLAIIVDEYSQVIGLITMEDLLEELVGEIQDEYDKPEHEAFVRRSDGSWLVDAMVPYDTVWEKTGIEGPAEEEHTNYHTLAGLILDRLGRIPSVGDKVTIGNAIMEVVQMDGRRIDRVLIRCKK